MASAVKKIVEGVTTRPKAKPKRALTAYNLFFKDERRKILEHGKAGGFAALAQTIAKRWKAITKEQYEDYAVKAKADKSRYENELAEWKATERSNPTEYVSEKRQIVKEIQKSMASQRKAMLIADTELKSPVGSPSFTSQQQSSSGLSGVRFEKPSWSSRSLSDSYLSGDTQQDYAQSNLRPRSHPSFALSESTDYDMQSVINERRLLEDVAQDSLRRMLADMPRQLAAPGDESLAYGVTRGFHRSDSSTAHSDGLFEYSSQGATMLDYGNTMGGGLVESLDDKGPPLQPQQAVFTPGSLRRIFDVDGAGMDSIGGLPDPGLEDPEFSDMDGTT